jgi:NAD(P)-dependent dehydrogenase (short-subunit alcohol dehydrogenase family)
MPKKTMPPQEQKQQPGIEKEMIPRPKAVDTAYKGSEKLLGKVALITGGDSGIGRAVAIAFAKEGASLAISYLSEHEDAEETRRMIEQEDGPCVLLPGDIKDEKVCSRLIEDTVHHFGKIDILVNNAAEQHPKESITDISPEQLMHTFQTNIFSMFYLTKAAVKHLVETKGVIINTTSVTAYRGSGHLLDYSATKGAIVSFTRSLSQQLAANGIRVNGVAPGPVWTPLITSTFPKEQVETFGGDVPLGRPGQPEEIASSYVFLASDDSSYMTGQILHPNGGEVING